MGPNAQDGGTIGHGRSSKLPLVVFSPFPPSKSGIAAYVAELMPFLCSDFDVTLVMADDAPEPIFTTDPPRVLLASEFRRYNSFFESAPKMYHVGNNPNHCYMLEMIGSYPGIVVMHDYNLNYLHECATREWATSEGYRSTLELEYGALGANAVRQRLESTDRGQFATYELPLNGDVLESATAVVAHSRYVQFKAAARVPRTPVWLVPHHVSPIVRQFATLSMADARAGLGLSQQEFVICAPGFVTYAKRISLLLRALAEWRTRLQTFRLVIAGEKRPAEYDVEADIDAFGLRDVTTLTGFLDEESFFRYLAASDLVVNLRHPSGGETSGTLIRALGMGVPSLIFDYGPMGELPEGIVAKIPWGDSSQRLLGETLVKLAADPLLRQKIGRQAAAYARSQLSIESTSKRYCEIVRRSLDRGGRSTRVYKQHFPHPGEAVRNFITKGKPKTDQKLWWRSAVVPLQQPGQAALVLSADPELTCRVLSDLFGWNSGDILSMTPAELLRSQIRWRDNERLPAGAFAFALLISTGTLPEHEAAGLFKRMNAAVSKGGVLTVEITYELDEEQSFSPLAESRMEQRLVDAGFAVLRSVGSQDALYLDLVTEHSHDEERRSACVMARKVSDYFLWRYTREVSGTPHHLGGRIF